MTAHPSDCRDGPRTLVGGVGYRWQRDASFGLAVSDRLAEMEWPRTVEVADLGYGALHVVDELLRADPPWERLVLVSAVARGREAGRLYRKRPDALAVPPSEEVQERIREAGAGVIDLDHLLVIGRHFGALPEDVVVFELEPEETDGGEGLSPRVQRRLPGALERVRAVALDGSSGAMEPPRPRQHMLERPEGGP